ncbi:MAG: PKD domain-containing protein, partial [Saprospiraceae bacterium]
MVPIDPTKLPGQCCKTHHRYSPTAVQDTVRWKELSRLADQYADLKWRWLYVNPANPTDTLGSNTPNTSAFVVPPIDSGTYLREIQLQVFIPTLDSTFSTDAPFAVFCSRPPAVNGISGPQEVEIGQRKTFQIRADERDYQVIKIGSKSQVIGRAANWMYEWDFGDGTVEQGAGTMPHTYEKNGNYQVKLTVTDTSTAAFCATTVYWDVQVGQESVFLPTLVLQKEKLKRIAIWGWAYYLLLALLGIGIIFHWVRWLMNRKKAATPPVEESSPPLYARFASGDKAPYFIPLRQQNGLITASRARQRLADALRLRQEGIRREVDVASSLKNTIEKGGFPTVQYKHLTQPTEYLCLIDQQCRNDHQARLFRFLTQSWHAQDVHIEVFYYSRHLTHCWNASFPKGMGLEQLKRQYSDHRLIVMGDAYDLIDPHALGLPNLRPSPANVLRQWRQRLLFSP